MSNGSSFFRAGICAVYVALIGGLVQPAKALDGGSVEGRAAGLISARDLAELVDGVGLLAGSKNWTANDQQQMIAWADDYFHWLTTSKIGLAEDGASNNHGTFYDVQAVSLKMARLPTAFSKTAYKVAMIDHDRILKLADQALTLKPPAITDQVATNSAGGLHDFFSQADYEWPNPNTLNGLPYVNRDGESNPNVFSYHRMAMRRMKDAVAALAAAYALTGDDKYVPKAVELLKVFFLDAKTRMNPNLQYAQAVLGKETGNAYGIIDSLHLAELPVAVSFLEKSAAFPSEVDQGLKKWFADYSEWILTSTNGVKEMNNANNHSIACFVQLASFSKFTGNKMLLQFCQVRFKDVLFPNQMTNNGSFPLELKRTKPYGYSIFQADNLATLCVLLSTTNNDFWKLKLADGRTPRNAVDFIYPYLADKNKWLVDGRGKDVMHWDDWPVRQPCLLFAYAEFGDEKYFDLWKKLPADPTDLEVRRNMAITQPLLWVASPGEVPLLKKRP